MSELFLDCLQVRTMKSCCSYICCFAELWRQSVQPEKGFHQTLNFSWASSASLHTKLHSKPILHSEVADCVHHTDYPFVKALPAWQLFHMACSSEWEEALSIKNVLSKKKKKKKGGGWGGGINWEGRAAQKEKAQRQNLDGTEWVLHFKKKKAHSSLSAIRFSLSVQWRGGIR